MSFFPGVKFFNAVKGPMSRLAFGTQGKYKTLPTQTQPQQDYISQLFSGLRGEQSDVPGLGYLQDLFSDDPSAFQKYEAPMMRQFNEQIIPGLAERFTNMGAGGNSSAFQNSATMAGARLSENLGAQRANLRGQGINQLQNYGQMAMQPSFENLYEKGQNGLLTGEGGAGIIQLLMSLLSKGMGV